MSAKILGLALIISITACDSDTPVATEETLAEDSVLAAQVLSAKGDSGYFGPVDDRIFAEDSVARVNAPKPKPQPKPVLAVVAPKPAPVLADVSVPLSEMPKRVTPKPVKPVRAGVISSGAALSLVTNQQVCSTKSGSAFRAVVVNAVRGSNDVVIPAGSQVIAEIISESKWGAGLSVRAKAVRLNGKSYPLSSRVSYVLPESSRGDACIPNRTRIDVKTTEPLRILASAN